MITSRQMGLLYINRN